MIDPQGQAIKWIKNMETKKVGITISGDFFKRCPVALLESRLLLPYKSTPFRLNVMCFLLFGVPSLANTSFHHSFLQGLKIIDLQQSDYLRTLENSVQFGNPVLLQNVQVSGYTPH